MKNTLWLLLWTVLFVACQSDKEKTDGNEESAKVQEYRQEVIAVHDEAMPLMSDIYQLKKELQSQLADTVSMEKSRIAEIKSILLKLDSADKGMRVWMREFSKMSITNVEEAEALRALEAEMGKIRKVRDDMFSSVAVAREATQH
jgi:hypothetical protein